jgi:NAD(P)-dependent dehydrogenase (short-subunit alcohol dehydrogenase family)
MMSTTALGGRSLVVVGASSGIGRGVAERGLRAGAKVVVAARRATALSDLVAELGGGHAVPTDLRDDESCRRLAEEVAAVGAPVDLLLISAGTAPLRRMERTSPQDWEDTLSTNLVGIHRVIVALLGHLSPTAVVAVVSSEVVHAPRSHLGAYGASKAALEHTLQQWQEEHPWLRFTTIALGATIPTEFGDRFAPDDLVEALSAWTSSGQDPAVFMNTDEVCDVLASTLASLIEAPSVGMPRIELRPPAPPETDQRTALADAGDDTSAQ